MLSVARLTGTVALLLGANELLKLRSWLQTSTAFKEPPHPEHETPKPRGAVGGGPALLPADSRPEPTADTPTELLLLEGGEAVGAKRLPKRCPEVTLCLS
jgi:hypothetical protein